MKLKPLPESLLKYKNYYQLSQEYNIPIATLRKRVVKLKIKGIWHEYQKHYTSAQVKNIISYGAENSRTHPVNIYVIEAYLKGFQGNLIALMLEVNIKIVYETIKEFKRSGCVTVHSSIDKVTFPKEKPIKKQCA